MPNAKYLAHQTPKYELYHVFYMCHFFETCYSTLSKFESVLFTFTIIYITFLFSLGPLPLSPHLLFLPSFCSFLHRIVSALSLTSFLCSLSLLHITASLFDETQAGASSHTTPHEPNLHSQITVHQHSHTNPTYTLRLPSTNTATRT